MLWYKCIITRLRQILFIAAVSRFAHDKVLPFVREMDENSQMDKGIINGMFEQGVSIFHIPFVHCEIYTHLRSKEKWFIV